MGRLFFVRYRTDVGTCIYFRRSIELTTVTVLHICESPLDYNALYKLVFSGRAHILPMIGINLPQEERRFNLTVH